MTPTSGGGWTETVLHSFNDNGEDGIYPQAALVFDKIGNLYGTKYLGGNGTTCSEGCGTVFELTPTSGGGWTETVLHSFNDNGTDGIYPDANLIFDAVGNLYSTTEQGGSRRCDGYSCGTVFEITP